MSCHSVGNETVASLTTILHIFGICPASWNEEIFMFADKYWVGSLGILWNNIVKWFLQKYSKIN